MDPDPRSAAQAVDPDRAVIEVAAPDGASAVPPLAVERLRRRADFLAVAAKRRSWSTPGLVLQGLRQGAGTANAGTGTPGRQDPRRLRLGFTVSRKVGNAVVRNRARRRLREAARLALRAAQAQAAAAPGTAPLLDGFDLVAIGRKETPERPFALLVADFAAALARLTGPRGKAR